MQEGLPEPLVSFMVPHVCRTQERLHQEGKYQHFQGTDSWRTECNMLNPYTVEPRYLELAYFELPLISKWKSGPCFNMKLWQQVTK